MTHAQAPAILPALCWRSFLRESVLFSASTILFHASRLGVHLFAASRLDPAVFGLWNALSLILLYGSIVTLGLIPAMNRELPLWQGRGDRSQAVRVRSVCWGWTVCSSLGAGLLLLAVSVLATLPPTTRTVLWWLGPLFVADQLYAYFQAYLKSDQRFGLMSRQQFLFAALLPVVAGPLILVHGLAGYMAGQAVGMLMLCVYIARKTGFRGNVKLERHEIGRLAHIGMPLLAAGLLLGFLITIDRWVIVTLLGIRPLGYFSISILVTGLLSLIPAAISQQVYPRMAETFGRSSTYAALTPWIQVQNLFITGAMLLVVVPVYFLLPVVVDGLLPQYRPGLGAARITLAGVLFLPLAGGAGNFLAVVNKQMYAVGLQLLTLLFNLAFNVTAVRLGMGLEGVALGTALSYLFYMVTLNTLVFVLVRRAAR
jgi:O-antigen/teichoic acid export membrane protein